MNTGVIYKITSPSGRIYIGQTFNYKKRLNFYKNCSAKTQVKLYKSFNKYTFENHIFEIIANNLDKYDINPMEEFYIKFYDCVNKGLNCTYSATAPMRGRKHTDKVKLKMSEIRKGKKPGIRTEEHKQNLSKAIKQSFLEGRVGHRKGVIVSKETRNKISNIKKGKTHTLEHRLKVSLNHRSRKLSIDTVLEIINIIKNKEMTTKEIALKYNISTYTVYNIRSNRRTDTKTLYSPR
jgi:group I intron endonuclease